MKREDCPGADRRALDGGRNASGGGWPALLLGRLKGRADSEHEQVLVRLAIALAALTYLTLTASGRGPFAAAAGEIQALGVAYAAASALLFAHLLQAPEPNPPRRLLGLGLDMTTLTLALVQGGSAGALFYPFYLWVILGMGFRYGRRYLLVSAALGLASFALVIAVSPYWQQQPALAAGLWGALIALPLYASKLLASLTRAIERAEAASLAKSRFLATISHELRTPLHAMLASADLLEDTALDAEQRQLVGTARTSGRALLTMIDDLLEVAATGEARIGQVERFDLHQLVATVSELVRLQAQGKGLAFRTRIDPAAPHLVRGSERALRQIMQNLLANAVRFTSQGSVLVRVRLLSRTGARVRLGIEVADTGIGISEEARTWIFERFRQADESTTRRFGGTGLGLAIARELADSIGADLSVESSPGAGSTFALEVPLEVAEAEAAPLRGEVLLAAPPETFDSWRDRIEALGATCRSAHFALPPSADLSRALLAVGTRPADPIVAGVPLVELAERTENASDDAISVLPPACSDLLLRTALHAALARPPRAGDARASSSGPPRRILVAEDNRINRQVIERILNRRGHAVTLVGNGEEALDALERDHFDLVLMDLNMPVMDGIEAVKLHRVGCPKDQAPVFAALTADVTEATRRACAEAGIDVVLTKPVEPERLLSLIAQLTADAQRAPPAGGQRGQFEAAARAARPDPPVLEPVHLERLHELDEDGSFVPMVLRDFLDDAQTLAGELEDAVAHNDSALFRDRAHALRSSAAYVGATALFDLCGTWRGIEARELSVRGAHHTARLRTELHRLEVALTETLPGILRLTPATGDDRS